MKFSSRLLLPTGCLVFAATALAGWQIASRSPAPAGTPEGGAFPSSHRADDRHPAPENERQSVEAIRHIVNPQERLLATIALANSIPAARLGNWVAAGRFTIHDGLEKAVFTGILLERWRKEDPEGYLGWQVSSAAGNVTYSLAEGMQDDPDLVRRVLRRHPNRGIETKAILFLASYAPEEAAAMIQDFALRFPDASSEFHDFFRNWASKDAAALEAAIPSFPSAFRDQLSVALWETRLKDSFDESLPELWKQPDGLKILRSQERFDTRILDHLLEMPQEFRADLARYPDSFFSGGAAADWLQTDLVAAGFSPFEAANIQQRAVRQISSADPEQALAFVASAEWNEDAKAEFYASILSQGGAEKQQSLIDSLPSQEDRDAATAALEKQREQEKPAREFRESLHELKPEDFFTKFDEGRSISNDSVFDCMQYLSGRDSSQNEALLQQFRNLPDEKKQAASEAIANYSTEFLSEDSVIAREAVTYLAIHPGGGEPSSHDAPLTRYVIGWSNKDPDAASTWVGTLPESDARTWAMKNLARTWQLYDPEAATRWLNAMPPGRKAEIQQYLDAEK